MNRPGNLQRIHPVIDTPLGRLIHERRQAMGMSQVGLAGLLDVDTSFLSRIEAGHRGIHPDQIPAFARVMGLDPYDLALAVAGFDPAMARAEIVRQANSDTLDTVITTLTALRDAPGEREIAA